jgi:hypothetical protein|eukprot:COSAG01_NODE_4429_length_5032_cov_5.648490_6_plen_59_part_00
MAAAGNRRELTIWVACLRMEQMNLEVSIPRRNALEQLERLCVGAACPENPPLSSYIYI